MPSLRKVITPITLFAILLFHSLATPASEETNPAVDRLNVLIQHKLDFYNQAFPEIQFAHLKNGEWEKSLQALDLFLGYQPTNMDYEHPADLRETLLFATVEKIRTMLIHGIPSSYLFKVGEIPAASRKYVCVITLKAETNVLSSRVATQSFIDLPKNVIGKLPGNKYLDKKQHLDFILDHEAFHCIDTLRFGGIPMSENTYSTQYSCYMRESQADMFAIAMNIKRQRKITPYVNNLSMIRGLTLLNGDCQHDSIDAIKLITDANVTGIVASSAEDLINKVKHDYKAIAPDYNTFVTHMMASISAMKQLGLEPVTTVKVPADPGIVNKKQVNKLIDRMRHYYLQYTGKEYSLPGQ